MQRRHLIQAAVLSTVATPSSADALQDDLELLEQVLRALHPGIERYLKPAAFSAGLNRLRQAWARAEGDAPRFLALNAFLASLRCGHSYPNFYNQRGRIKSELVLDPPRLPLHFEWLPGGRAVVTRAADGVVLVGSELLALDGRPLPEVFARLLPLVRADGSNDAARAALLSPRGVDEIETFDVLYPLVFGAKPAFQVHWREPEGREHRRELAGITDVQRRAMARSRPAEYNDAAPAWPLTLRERQQAVLTMPDWVMYRTRWDWQAYLGRVFERLAAERVQHLVVDLRGNEGGNDCGDALIAHLIDQPLRHDLYERRTAYRRVPEPLNTFLDTWDDSFRDWGDSVTPIPGTRYWRQRASDSAVIEPLAPRFTGRVTVLVDGSNHSATFRFNQIVQRHGLARLVGSPTGGNQRGGNGGAFFFLHLPATGIEVDVPLIGTFAREALSDAGLRPDWVLVPSLKERAAQQDGVMERVLRG